MQEKQSNVLQSGEASQPTSQEIAPETQDKPIEPITVPPKPKNHIKLLLIIFGAIILVGIGVFAYFLLKGPDNEPKQQKQDEASTDIKEQNETSTKNKERDEASTEIKEQDENSEAIPYIPPEYDPTIVDDNEIKEVLDKLYSQLSKSLPNGGFHIDQEKSVYYSKIRVGDGIVTLPNRAYSLISDTQLDTDAIYKILDESYNISESVLSSNGYQLSSQLYPTGAFVFFNPTTEIYCTITRDLPISIGCSKSNWIDNDDKNLVITLANIVNTSTMYVSSDDIENSPIPPYQRVQARSTNGSFLFYRLSPDSPWINIFGGNASIECKLFDSEAKKAFAGTKCYNEAGNFTTL